MIFPKRLRWLWLTLAVVFADRLTKAWFETQTPEGWRHEVVPKLIYLVHSKNPGVAFSVLADMHSPVVRWALIFVALIIIGGIAWMLVASKTLSTGSAAGLALLLGGATGNVTDRIVHGSVTDFLEIWLGTYRWPAFNVADAAITVGAVLVILEMLLGKKQAVEQG